MKAPYNVEYLPPVAAYSSIYLGSHRKEKDCRECPFNLDKSTAGTKCKATGEYNPTPGNYPSVCPYPSKPAWIKDSRDISRPVCPEGSAIIDLRTIHWTKRAEVGQEDMDRGCIPAMADRGGEPRPLEGFWIEVQALAGSRSKWSYYRITWRRKDGAQ